MKTTVTRLEHLKEELYTLTKNAQSGNLEPNRVAEKIVELRDEIDSITEHLKNLKRVIK